MTVLYIYIYIYNTLYYILIQLVYTKHLHQRGPCRKKFHVTFMYLSTRSQKKKFHQW